jgi:hypothetical protein
MTEKHLFHFANTIKHYSRNLRRSELGWPGIFQQLKHSSLLGSERTALKTLTRDLMPVSQ